jgi:hypothetical protein
MAIVTQTPSYCSNCQHKRVCKILPNIFAMDEAITKFNQDNADTLQAVSSINYNCREKLKTV